MTRSFLAAALLALPACQQASPTSSEAAAALDPKSPQAAAALVSRYFALVRAGKSAEARALRPAGDAISFAGAHAIVEAPSAPEGACGSVYVQVPVRLSGPAGERRLIVNLRRVNDVDGSTSAQRRWHIESIEPSPT